MQTASKTYPLVVFPSDGASEIGSSYSKRRVKITPVGKYDLRLKKEARDKLSSQFIDECNTRNICVSEPSAALLTLVIEHLNGSLEISLDHRSSHCDSVRGSQIALKRHIELDVLRVLFSLFLVFTLLQCMNDRNNAKLASTIVFASLMTDALIAASSLALLITVRTPWVSRLLAIISVGLCAIDLSLNQCVGECIKIDESALSCNWFSQLKVKFVANTVFCCYYLVALLIQVYLSKALSRSSISIDDDEDVDLLPV